MDNEHSAPPAVTGPLDRACRAFSLWASAPVAERKILFKRLRSLIVERQKELAALLAEETDQPITEAVSQEITPALEMIRFIEKAYPGWLADKKFRFWRPGFWTKSNRVRFEPLGLIAVIGPSNFPFSLPVMQAGSALFCGNSVILKPSERCPRTAKFLRRLFHDSGFPEGVIEVIEGGPKAVESIIAAESVRKVIFTGSYETGRIISELCGRFFKPCLLELGGMGPAIIADDADLILTARGIAWSAFYSGGSSCVGTKRVFLTSETSRAFVPLLLAEVKKIRPGNPSDPNTEMATAKKRDVFDRMEGLVRDAVEKGAAAWTLEGEIGDGPSQGPRGPVILFQVTPRMKIIAPDGEWDAPILCLRDVKSIDQAVDEANRSSFGLGASVWSRDLRRAQEIARRLQAGIVWINDSSVGLPGFPWGGTKHSGWGRLLSREALTELTNLKVISRDRRLTSSRKFWWFPYSREKYETLLSLNEFLYGRRKGRRFRLFLRSWLRWMFR